MLLVFRRQSKSIQVINVKDSKFTVVVVVVVVSHIQRIGCQPEKTTLHGGQSRSWSAEQGSTVCQLMYTSIYESRCLKV